MGLSRKPHHQTSAFTLFLVLLKRIMAIVRETRSPSPTTKQPNCHCGLLSPVFSPITPCHQPEAHRKYFLGRDWVPEPSPGQGEPAVTPDIPTKLPGVPSYRVMLARKAQRELLERTVLE